MRERRRNESPRRLLAAFHRAALAGADPAAGVERALRAPAVRKALARARRVGVFAVGKAAAGMLRGARDVPGRALAVLPRGFPRPGRRGAGVLFAAHPEPDAASVAAARRALAFFSGFGAGDAILCLVSGGASALLELPRRGLRLSALRRAVRERVAAGAGIAEVNRLRARLSAVKGGGLGRATAARLVTLVLSDVPGDRPALVGSGPTLRGRRGDVVRVVGTNRSGLEAAAGFARARGLRAAVLPRRLSGEARRAGAAFARAAARLPPGAALLAGGETTVALDRRAGKGGRTLEFALGAARELSAARGVAVLAASSDGRDGSSDAAGAFADRATLRRAVRLGLDPDEALRRHDTEPFFAALGDLFRTGPTGTNVADWAFAVRTR